MAAAEQMAPGPKLEVIEGETGEPESLPEQIDQPTQEFLDQMDAHLKDIDEKGIQADTEAGVHEELIQPIAERDTEGENATPLPEAITGGDAAGEGRTVPSGLTSREQLIELMRSGDTEGLQAVDSYIDSLHISPQDQSRKAENLRLIQSRIKDRLDTAADTGEQASDEKQSQLNELLDQRGQLYSQMSENLPEDEKKRIAEEFVAIEDKINTLTAGEQSQSVETGAPEPDTPPDSAEQPQTQSEEQPEASRGEKEAEERPEEPAVDSSDNPPLENYGGGKPPETAQPQPKQVEDHEDGIPIYPDDSADKPVQIDTDQAVSATTEQGRASVSMMNVEDMSQEQLQQEQIRLKNNLTQEGWPDQEDQARLAAVEASLATETQASKSEQSHNLSEQVKLDHTEDIIIDGKLVQVFKEPDGSYRRVTYEGDTPEGNATMTISTPDGRELTVQTTADHIADAYEIPEDPDEEAAETPLTHEQQVDAKRKMLEDMGIYNGITPEGALTPAARRAMKNQEWRRRHPAPEQLMSSREGQEASQTEAEQQLQLLQQQMAELRQEMRAIHALLDRQLQQGRGEPQSGRAPAEQVGLPRRQRREGARQADVIRNPTIPPGIRDMSERARARLANQLPPDALQALGLTTGGQLDEGVNPPGWNFLPSEQGRQGEPPGGDTGEAFRQILSGDIVDPDTRKQIASQLSAEQRAQYGIDDEGNVLQPRETFPGPLPPAGEGQYPNLEDRQEIPLGPGQRVGLFFGKQWDRMMLLPEGIVHGVRDAWEGRKIRKNAEAADRAEKHADHYIAERDRYDAAAAELIGDRQERVARFREKQRQFGLI